MQQFNAVQSPSEIPERMKIARSDTAEVAKVDAQFEGGVGRTHEFCFIKPKAFDEVPDMRQGSLADADDADLSRFDELNRARIGQMANERCRRHPARSPAANNDDMLASWFIRHIAVYTCSRSSELFESETCSQRHYRFFVTGKARESGLADVVSVGHQIGLERLA